MADSGSFISAKTQRCFLILYLLIGVQSSRVYFIMFETFETEPILFPSLSSILNSSP